MTSFAYLDTIWGDDKAVRDLCDKATPSDFYACFLPGSLLDMDDNDNACYVSICPKEYFDRHDCEFDQTLPIDHLLPKDFSEAMEGVYEATRPLKDVRQDLLELGFKESKRFSKIIGENYDER